MPTEFFRSLLGADPPYRLSLLLIIAAPDAEETEASVVRQRHRPWRVKRAMRDERERRDELDGEGSRFPELRIQNFGSRLSRISRQSRPSRLRVLGPQLVAHAPDGEKEGRTGRVLLDLLPQRMNVNIERVLFESITFSPDPVEHLLPREHAAG